MVEVKKIVEQYGVGEVADSVCTSSIAKAVRKVLEKPKEYWKENCLNARENLHWGADAHVIHKQLEKSQSQPWVKLYKVF